MLPVEVNLDLVESLPDPVGYKVLVVMPKKSETIGTKGLIIAPESTRKAEETAGMLGYVLKLGPDAYADESKYPNGAWCKEGDWVMFRSYSGTRFKIGDVEYRLINDDTIEGVTVEPGAIERAY